jgi:hypothetical protein
MTPAEKAQELYLKYYGIPLYIKTVKECCHIAINEIKEQLVSNLDNDVSGIHAIYWEKVKQEIDKLK